jgi:hypothetical protein
VKLKKVTTAAQPVASTKIQQVTTTAIIRVIKVTIILTTTQPYSKSKYCLLQL